MSADPILIFPIQNIIDNVELEIVTFRFVSQC
jgi:hypothetical protein